MHLTQIPPYPPLRKGGWGDFEALRNMRVQLERLYLSTSTVVVGGLS